jgi:hypothetical protein
MLPRPARAMLATMAVACACSRPLALPAAMDSGAPSPVEASTDAGTGEASSDTGPDMQPDAMDAMTDAGRPDAGSWCAVQGLHLFCEDFDHGALGASWDQIQQQHGVPRLDGTAYTSPYESFLASTTALTQGAVASVGLSKRVTYLATEMHLAYDLRVDAQDPAGSPVVVSSLQMLDSASDILEVINVLVGSSGGSVDDSATLDGGAEWDHTHSLGALTIGQWTRIKLDAFLPGYDSGPEPGTLSVTVGTGTTPVVDHVPLSPVAQLAQPFFYLGVVSASGPSTPVAVRFDDVTFDVQP